MKIEFKKYPKLKRYGDSEVKGIHNGKLYVFPKIDGSNGSLWWDEEINTLKAGSRNRELTLDNDNAAFYNTMINQDVYITFLKKNPNYILYGEWLVQHKIKYPDELMKQFYVFDVFDVEEDRYLEFHEYHTLLSFYNIPFIPCIAMINNSDLSLSEDDVLDLVQEACSQDTFLIGNDRKGKGEGVVIKNYNWVNRFGNKTYAKYINKEFNDNKHKKKLVGTLEFEIANKYITSHLITKNIGKIETEQGRPFESDKFNMLIGRIWHDLITEEIWDILKKNKNPTINFKSLQKEVINQIRSYVFN